MRDIKDDNDAEIMYAQRVLGHTFLSTLVLDAEDKITHFKRIINFAIQKMIGKLSASCKIIEWDANYEIREDCHP